MYQLIALFLTALTVQSIVATPLPGFSECMLNGRFYEIGEFFHPVVHVDGQEYEAVCYNCTCQPTTIVECEEVYCPPVTDCPISIRLDGACCPICLTSGKEMPSGPKQCLYEGLNIAHGKVFHPTSMLEAVYLEMEGLKNISSKNITSENPFCTSCQCDDGVIECTDLSSLCPPLSCDLTQAVLPEYSCCLECSSVLPPTFPPGTKKACRDDVDGATYNHGDIWHPLFPGYGRVECINCTCNDGSTSCVKDPCPEVPFCAPGMFITEPVLCCPSCIPGGNVSPTELAVSTPSPCQSKDYIINIYKHTSNDSLALENNDTDIVYVYSWTPASNGGLVKSIDTLSSTKFTEMNNFNKFEFVGKTLLRRVNGLSSREGKRDRIRRCMKDCSALVVNMLRPVTHC